MTTPPALERARNFAEELSRTVDGVLPNSPEFRAIADERGSRVLVSTFGDDARVASLPLSIDGRRVASWKLTMYFDLDSAREYLKVVRSNFSLSADVDKTPLVRYEFVDDMLPTVPVAHWQFHGERGAFSHLLGQALAAGKQVKPHSLSSVHFPVGGGRMRPGIDDLLEFLVRECGFDSRPGWEAVVDRSRADYRTIQARTIARDMQSEVADLLRSVGWTVEPPAKGPPDANTKFLTTW